ncbi:NAD-glutamate dehydrogenase domain-containing protein [Candidatus Deianiraea vastatrix]|uniref:NAD-specific glutamate dehydrogenase n=1 Tax=Candidatus Deianiraea vastatrix TaxID=2163644 RepID=A0A5B8XDQ4_9RICK|nr:NAD-glutamate dehydrogenase domain-containing protein [Candidatus Deianiraea vastatrix]QED23442.1 NAD-specific glutamate dehydrogenase [Candidatus Deianiraea vastatrix]
MTQENHIFPAVLAYYKQINRDINESDLLDLIRKNSGFEDSVVSIFKLKFKTKNKEWEVELEKLKSKTKEPILLHFLQILNAAVRTNLYQDEKDYIAIKLKPEFIENMPKPIPYAEIMVYNEDFEGCHLRSQPISRGGFRWSDRADYRTEVLGLVKAQISKNAIIVPSGAKACFYIKKPKQDKAENMAFVKACYEKFVCGLLDITDNIEADRVINPKNTVIYDENDTYIVAAADKGTATFSDLANSISKRYNFWLGDAFASGGSLGYDHKKMGITSRGAYICAKSSFYELGIDAENTEISAVGIGDMSGDVFGNGMLLFKKLKLMAAFNHMHIFIDPNPDIEKTALERRRLFENPQLKWSDFDKSIISQGGGVFDRFGSDIEINEQIRASFDIPKSVKKLNPEALIGYILRAKIDLLFNGGIGTFIKAECEKNEDVKDKFNDTIRINGNEARFKVIAEGGNVGITQLGRMELVKSGVKVNMDAIDNSAGVTCSDREVNIKIALSVVKISDKGREKLLFDMTGNVAALVLKNNYLQSKLIGVTETFAQNETAIFAKIASQMEIAKVLDRKMHQMPSEEEFLSLAIAKKAISRTQICVMLSNAKIYLKNIILESDLLRDNYFKTNHLLEYFPRQMQEDMYLHGIFNHSLAKNIIATEVAGEIVNICGISYFYKLRQMLDLKVGDAVKLYSITQEIFGIKALFEMLCKEDGVIEFANQARAIKKLQDAALFASIAISSHVNFDKTIEENIHNLKQIIDQFFKILKGSCCSDVKKSCCFDSQYTAGLKVLKSADIISICMDSFEKNYQQTCEIAKKVSDNLGYKSAISKIFAEVSNGTTELKTASIIASRLMQFVVKSIKTGEKVEKYKEICDLIASQASTDNLQLEAILDKINALNL